MIHLSRFKEAQELYDEAERSAMIAIIILETALRHKAAAAAHERGARRLFAATVAANGLLFGLWLGIIITGG
jgi:hypothetical protein